MPDNTILSYADDTAIISSGNTWSEVEIKLNKYLMDVSEWLALNKLSLNIGKTVHMTLAITVIVFQKT